MVIICMRGEDFDLLQPLRLRLISGPGNTKGLCLINLVGEVRAIHQVRVRTSNDNALVEGKNAWLRI